MADEIVYFIRRQEEVTDFVGTSSERALAMVKANHKSEKGYKKAKLLDCKKCGRRHGSKACPAYGAECHNCGGRNHFRTKCYKKKVNVLDQISYRSRSRRPSQETNRQRILKVSSCWRSRYFISVGHWLTSAHNK